MKKRYYFDSSAWFKRYFEEKGSSNVRSLMSSASEVCISEVGVAEIISVLRRQVRERNITETEYKMAKYAVIDDLRASTVLPVDYAVINEAIQCLEGASLQGCDSVHVASARLHGCELFVTADKQQGKAAKALGLKVKEL